VRVTACVVSWNSAAQLGGALDSLLALREGPRARLDEVVVVDNASVDGSRDVVRARPDVRLVANDRNRGFAGGANQGIAAARAAGSDAFLVCNPDVRLEADYLSVAGEALAADPRRAAVQGRLWRMTGDGEPIERDGHRVLDTTGHLAFTTRLFRNRGEGQPDDGRFDTAGEVFGVSGALALYRLDALDDVACAGEVYDEDLFAYWEDVDLDWRLQLRGWHAWYAPDARAWHERGGAGPRRSAFVERLNFTNRFLVVLKDDDPVRLARALPGVAATSLLKAGELAVTVPSAFLSSAAGLRLVPRILAKRRLVQASATVPSAAVVDRWFGPFDYAAWVRTWWRRVTARSA
jgi:GT2 family glycosyltransferase